MEQKKNRKEKDSVRLSVTLPKKRHNYVKDLAEKNRMSIATVLNVALEYNLDNYLSNIRYIDSVQGEKIEKTVLEIADNSRHILNNIKRIGINYNQELKLKNAEKKYEAVKNNKNSSTVQKEIAKMQFDAEKSELERTCLNKNELNTLLEEYEKITEEMRELTCRILG